MRGFSGRKQFIGGFDERKGKREMWLNCNLKTKQTKNKGKLIKL